MAFFVRFDIGVPRYRSPAQPLQSRLAGELLGGEGAEDAELVALRIGEHHPASRRRPGRCRRAWRPCASARATSAAWSVGSQVDVEAHLLALRLRHPQEQEVGRHARPRGCPPGGSSTTSSALLVGDAPPEQLGPPVTDRARVGGVDADALPAKSHGRGLPNVCARSRPQSDVIAHRRWDRSVGSPRWARAGTTSSSRRRATGASRRRSRRAWELAVVPQGGVVAALAVRAMERELGDPDADAPHDDGDVRGPGRAAGRWRSTCRSLRRGRSMSQLTATVRNPGADAGLTAIAAFGAPAARLRLHRAGDAGRGRARRRCGASAIRSPRASTSSSTATPLPVLGARSSRADRSSGGHRGRSSWTGRPRSANWYRLDDPPLRARRHPRPAGVDRDVRHDARLGRPEARPRQRAVVRAERRLHAPPVPARPPEWLLAHQQGPPRRRRLRQRRVPPSGTRRPTAPPSSPTPPSSCSSRFPRDRSRRAHAERLSVGGRGGSRSRRRGRRRSSC